jgi:hypothetical protein
MPKRNSVIFVTDRAAPGTYLLARMGAGLERIAEVTHWQTRVLLVAGGEPISETIPLTDFLVHKLFREYLIEHPDGVIETIKQYSDHSVATQVQKQLARIRAERAAVELVSQRANYVATETGE